MRNFKLSMLAVLGVLWAGSAMAATPAAGGSLIPQPAQWQPAAQGAVTIADGDTVWVQAPGNAEVLAVAQRFAARVLETRGMRLRVVTEADRRAPASIVLRLAAGGSARDGAYQIDIDTRRIEVSAASPRGLFYGAVSVWQLLTPAGAHGVAVRVPAGRIVDAPRFAWRGLMLDSARHFQRVEDIKKLLDWMSLHKLNVLHWHLTDDQGWRLQVPKYPELTRVGACRKAVGPDAALTGSASKPYCGFYTEADVRAIVAYATQRYITIVPEIDVPGHAQAAIAAYPWLGVTGQQPQVSTDWGINTWLLKPDARTLGFLDDVFDEVMRLFPAPWIHIGGDEAAKDQWLASPDVQAHMRALGLTTMTQLQGWFTTRVADYLAKHGRTAVGWDEILDGPVPAGAVVMSWREPAGALAAIERGHAVVVSSSPTLYFDHYQSGLHDEPPGRPAVESLQDIYDFNPVPPGANAAQADKILGVQANLWAEYMPSFARVQHAVFPRLAALAELAWSPAAAHDWQGFLARMPAELGRYATLGIGYADSAFAPAFSLQRGAGGRIEVTLANQSGYGSIRYTRDGTAPTSESTLYTAPLSLPAAPATTLRAASFAADGAMLATPRTQVVGAAALLTRNSDQIEPCSNNVVLRLEDDRPLFGKRPVYRLDIMNTCWQWPDAPLDGVTQVKLTVGNLPWNFQLWKDDAGVKIRPKSSAAGEIQVHQDACDGPLLASLPLAAAARSMLQTSLIAKLPPTRGAHTLCFIATGDPHQGLWAIDKVELLHP